MIPASQQPAGWRDRLRRWLPKSLFTWLVIVLAVAVIGLQPLLGAFFAEGMFRLASEKIAHDAAIRAQDVHAALASLSAEQQEAALPGLAADHARLIVRPQRADERTRTDPITDPDPRSAAFARAFAARYQASRILFAHLRHGPGGSFPSDARPAGQTPGLPPMPPPDGAGPPPAFFALNEPPDPPSRAEIERHAETVHVGIALPGDRMLELTMPSTLAGSHGPFFWRLYVELALRIALVIVIALVIARAMTRPLRQLADAADALGADLRASAVPERGPTEIRRTAHAFNLMQQRLLRYVDDRTRMVLAISHDLRTPLTRALLRLEMLPESPARSQSIDDLMELRAMIEQTLEFGRNEQQDAPRESVELCELLVSLAGAIDGERIDTRAVDLDAPRFVRANRVALLRLFRNLLDNAMNFAGQAWVSIEDAPRGAGTPQGRAMHRIRIRDDGPGIPAAERARVFEPFYRIDESRNKALGGVGLGLAIVRDVVRACDGEIALGDAPQGGLEVTIDLPIETDPVSSLSTGA